MSIIRKFFLLYSLLAQRKRAAHGKKKDENDDDLPNTYDYEDSFIDDDSSKGECTKLATAS